MDGLLTEVADHRAILAQERLCTPSFTLTPYSELKQFEVHEGLAELTTKELLVPNTIGYYFFKKYLREVKDEVVLGQFLEAIDYFQRSNVNQQKKLANRIYRQYLDPLTAGTETDVFDPNMCPHPPAPSPNEERPPPFDGTPVASPQKYQDFANLLLEANKERIKQLAQAKGKFAYEVLVFHEIASILEEKKYITQFKTSDLWMEYVQMEHYSTKPVSMDDFEQFRILGRGAFGAVRMVKRSETQAVFACKALGRRQVKYQEAQSICKHERDYLALVESPFVLSLKYSFLDDDNLYLLFEMCAGGDLAFHLDKARDETKRGFSNERTQLYAAEVLLGLEHLHSHNIVYRDLKPANVLLDKTGHAVLSDLGLCTRIQPGQIKRSLAGTAGYWAPEIVRKAGTFPASDWWSYGVFIFVMLTGGKRPKCKCKRKTKEWCPFGVRTVMETNALLDDGILKIAVEYSDDIFTPEAKDLLSKLFDPDHKTRLGSKGAQAIRDHPYFSNLNWEDVKNRAVEPPFKPEQREVNAGSLADVGDFDDRKYDKVELTEKDFAYFQDFAYVNHNWLQEELYRALFLRDNPPDESSSSSDDGGCCTIL